MAISPRLDLLAKSIARYEGFFVTPSDAKARGIAFPTVPQRCNNPGDLLFMKQPGATSMEVKGADGRVRVYASFSTIEQGWQALYAQIEMDAKRGELLGDFIARYAPAADANDPDSYAKFVAQRLGVDLLMPLSEVIAS